MNNRLEDELELKSQLKDVHATEHLRWLTNTITQEFLSYLEKEIQDTFVKTQSALCASPVDKAVRLAVRSKTLTEIIIYARRSE